MSAVSADSKLKCENLYSCNYNSTLSSNNNTYICMYNIYKTKASVEKIKSKTQQKKINIMMTSAWTLWYDYDDYVKTWNRIDFYSCSLFFELAWWKFWIWKIRLVTVRFSWVMYVHRHRLPGGRDPLEFLPEWRPPLPFKDTLPVQC